MTFSDLTPENTIKGASDGTDIGNISDALKVVGSGDYDNPMVVDFTLEHHDAFARLRMSTPTTLFHNAFTYTEDFDQHWTTSTASGGTVTHDSTTGQRILAVTTTTGSKAVMQTRRRVQYVKGKSQLIYTTGTFNALQTGVRKRMGYYEESNGVFFECDGTSLYTVYRSDVSGSVVDTRTISSSWNIDPFDGTGPSGLTADPSQHYLFIIDFSWLGSNILRYGLVAGGNVHYCHQINFSGEVTVPWMFSAHLPLRYEIESTGTPAAVDQIDITCQTVISEGGDATLGRIHTVDTGTSPVNVNTTASAAAGLRLKTTAKYAALKSISFDILAVSGNTILYWQIIQNGTFTSPTWASLSDLTEYMSNTPNYTAGTGYVLDSGYIDLNNGSGKNKTGAQGVEVISDVYMGHDLAGVADTLTLVCETTSGTGTILFSGLYREFF